MSAARQTAVNNVMMSNSLVRRRRNAATRERGPSAPIPPPARGPAGFSLLEVILAMAILIGSLVVIGQLIHLGARSGVRARMETDAILRCESKVAELVAGVIELKRADPTPFEDDPSWQWSIAVEPGPDESLLAVTVTVEETPQQGRPITRPEEAVSFSIRRWMRNPDYAVEEPPLLPEEGQLAPEAQVP